MAVYEVNYRVAVFWLLYCAEQLFINEKNFVKGKFQWQEGYGVFSYSQSHIDQVFQYIKNQEEHHRKKTFKEEYIEFLNAFQIEHKPEYLFEWIE